MRQVKRQLQAMLEPELIAAPEAAEELVR
jgi:hypothetical protein